MSTVETQNRRSLAPLHHRVEHYFFAPCSAFNLSLARIVVFTLVFWKSLSRAWYTLADWPSPFLEQIALEGVPYVTKEYLIFITAILSLFSLLGAVGVAVRASAVLCFLSLYFLNAIDGGPYDSGWALFSFLLLFLYKKQWSIATQKKLQFFVSSTTLI